MIDRAALTERLGVTSISASSFGGVLLIVMTDAQGFSRAAGIIPVVLGLAGLLAGVAGIIASRGLGRMPWLAIIGCILNLPVLFFGYIVSLFAFGGA